MQLLGLLLTGAALLLLCAVRWLGENKPAKGARRSRGVILEARPDGQKLTARYTAGRDTFTLSLPAPPNQQFYAGQQVLVDYLPEEPSQPIQILSYSAAWGRQLLGFLAACLLLMLGIILIRLSD